MEEKNQNTEEKKDLTQEEIEDVQGGMPMPNELLKIRCPNCGFLLCEHGYCQVCDSIQN